MSDLTETSAAVGTSPKRQCTSKAKGTGARCKRSPVPGAEVCVVHGGAAPQVRAKAAERLLTARIRGELAKAEITPITDPAAAYADLAGRESRPYSVSRSAMAETACGEVNTTDICTGCHARPRPDEAFICQECGDQWHGDLQAVPGWLDELRVEAMKLSRKTASTGRGSAEPPSPVDWTASRYADEIRWHLVTAIQVLTLGQTPTIPDATDAMVDWLLANEDRLPYREQAGDLTAGLHALIQRAAKLCDRPDEKRYYLGACRVCEQAMRTSRAMGLHRCCGEVYDIEQAYAETLARLHDPDNNLTQAEAATLLGVTVNAIKQRVKHRGVQPVIDGRRGVWYRLGDLA